MAKAIVIKTSGKIERMDMDSLQDLQKAVGGYIEAISINWENRELTVYCNEEGRVHELPINMACCMWLSQNGMYPALETPIHGDVVVIGECDDEGNDTDVPEGLEIPSLWKEPSFEIFFGKEAEKMLGF
jgi:hypothetical protein